MRSQSMNSTFIYGATAISQILFQSPMDLSTSCHNSGSDVLLQESGQIAC